MTIKEKNLQHLRVWSAYLKTGRCSNLRATALINSPTRSQWCTLATAPKGRPKCCAVTVWPLCLKTTFAYCLCSGCTGTLLKAESMSACNATQQNNKSNTATATQQIHPCLPELKVTSDLLFHASQNCEEGIQRFVRQFFGGLSCRVAA